ncbi:magnesium/cobalt transporter CorA [Desulfospira joergensenii]|uniref:magnesium/cobalt transporter CorA n=1 Tax=Desulfospira joergensenii TaxID=53329 RepID=UPI0003B6223F|nr:magnesium/cobalt transporter CorA [Desulfospira joergensenii]
MPRFIKKSNKKSGSAPGTLILEGEARVETIKISLLDYDQDGITDKEIKNVEEAFPFKEKKSVSWIHIQGLHDIPLLEKLGRHFGIHNLTLEDIVNPGQRPKAEDFDDYLYVVFKQLTYDGSKERVGAEQISLIVGQNFLISFQETGRDYFKPVRERIRDGKGRIRKHGSGYLAYALMDASVDDYYNILSTVGDKIEDLEQDLLDNPEPSCLDQIHKSKREMIFFRKQVWPVREVLSKLMKSDSALLHESTDIFLADVYDHIIHVIDIIESFRELLSSMLDLYLSTVSNRMNEVMKVLTIIATIFIPLTFLAGIYGMNFEFMPELKWKWGYYILLVIMAGIGGIMVGYFKRKKWL